MTLIKSTSLSSEQVKRGGDGLVGRSVGEFLVALDRECANDAIIIVEPHYSLARGSRVRITAYHSWTEDCPRTAILKGLVELVGKDLL